MAGAGFKTFNTGDVLTASDVNTYLMQQTVMVFDDASARSTALTGVVAEGMLSYLKDTNAVEVYDGSSWVASDDPNAIQNSIVDAKGDLISATADNTPARLAVGANDTVLTADSSTSTGLKWAAPSSGALTLTGSASFTGSSAVNVNDCFSTTYLTYLIYVRISAASTNNVVRARMRVSGTDASGGNYNWYGARNNGSWAFITGGGATSFDIGTTNGGTGASIDMTINAPFETTATLYNSRSGANNNADVYGGCHTLNTSYTGISLITSTGTIDGSIRVYGLANS